MYNLYLRSFAGVNPENGNSLWYVDTKDADGNVVEKGGTTENYSEAAFYETGDILPKVYGGFGTELKAYGVDLSVAFNYQAGGRIRDVAYMNLMHGGYSSSAGQNWHTDILNAWTPENTNTNVPRLNAGDRYTAYTSTRFLTSASYLSINNVTVGYTLPKKLVSKIGLNSLRVYFVGDNLALFAKRKGLDPRQGFVSSIPYTYTQLRTLSGGISVSF